MENIHEELEEARAEITRLKSNLDYKECMINQLNSTNDTHRVESNEKVEKLEEESREKEARIKSLLEETENLRAVVEALQNKRAEAEKEEDLNRERRVDTGDFVDELQDKNRKLEDELKWKVEQFRHLEEAHEKLREQLNTSKSEWEAERSSLVDEIKWLSTTDDDRHRDENSSGEENVDDLRHSLRVKEMELKDLDYKVRKLEKENEEILGSLKELQEAQIPRAVPTPSSWAKLRGKFKTLEQSHRECSANLKVREAEWRSQSQKFSFKLKAKDGAIEELRNELYECNANLTQLKMQNEELSLMLQLMRSEAGEDGSNQSGLGKLMGQLEKERDEKRGLRVELEEECERVRQLRVELEQVYDALDRIDSELLDLTNQGGELGLELEGWMTLVERLKLQLEESQERRRELEASLLEQAEVEEMLNRDALEKDRRIGNLEQQILLMDQEIRIGEDDEIEEDNEADADDDDRLHVDLLARELELAILSHITEERSSMHQAGDLQQSLLEDGFAKENVIQQNFGIIKTMEAIIDERSPFRVLN